MKKWYESKTIWVNVLSFIGSSLMALTQGDWVADNPEAVAIVGGVVAVINIVLRKITKEEIK